MFGGAKNADVDNDIVLNITNGSSLERVFGGNNTSGAINGTITVNIEESGCEPIKIQELYAGGYLAPYSIYGYETESDGAGGTRYKTESVPYIDTDGSTKSLVQRIPLTTGSNPRQNPRINVISATQIDNIFGGGYQAKLVGDPHVNVNMTNGYVAVTKVEVTKAVKTEGDVTTLTSEESGTTYVYYTVDKNNDKTYYDPAKVEKGDHNYVYRTESGDTYEPNKVDKQEYRVTLDIGTIGNIYGGGNLADVIGDTYVDIGTGEWLNKDGQRVMLGTSTVDEITTPTTFTYNETSKKWTYEKSTTTSEEITGNPTPSEGSLPESLTDGYQVLGTAEGVSTVTTFTYHTTTTKWTYEKATTVPEPITGVPTPVRNAATITENVFGGGKGRAVASGDDAFSCEKAMIGIENSGEGSTNVLIGNGTVGTLENGALKAGTGNVYGGGMIGRVEKHTSVTIGLATGTSAPNIMGSVFGAGQGIYTHGYSGLVRGNSTVIVQNHAKVGRSVYGGGEMATVGSFWVKGINDTEFSDKDNPKYADVPTGMPYALKNGGQCTVTVKDYVEIGPDNMKMTADGGPDDTGYVFGAGRGMLPYKNPDYTSIDYTSDDNIEGKPWRIDSNGDKEFYDNDADYLQFIETLALVNKTEVTIGGNAFIKGSVYGGSENGRVLNDTHVTIQEDCQIGNGYLLIKENENTIIDRGLNRPYTSEEWAAGHLIATDADFDATELAAGLKDKVNTQFASSLPECASWEYKAPYASYDILDLDANSKPKHATDGHTFYGNVFGGGSGLFPYKRKTGWTPKETGSNVDANGYSDGVWHEGAGAVYGNTTVEIKGGHILTSIYGGNEMTNVGKANDANTGISTVKMSGGTLGVPRTLAQIAAHPVTCYLFGAGKGDQRINFNTTTNVNSVLVEVTDEARIYGSVFGGGEDGHVLGNVQLDIKTGKNITVGTGDNAITYRYPYIGTTGTSYVDGNIFGGGRGYSGEALTAGSVGGNVTVNISDGTMLGSVYGGGRLASVGTRFAAVTSDGYGQLQPDADSDIYYTQEEIDAAQEGDDAFGKTTNDIKYYKGTHGHVTINISGGTIGNDREDKSYEVEVETNNLTSTQIETAKRTGLQALKVDDNIPNTDFELYDSVLVANSTTKYKYNYRTSHMKGGNVFGGAMGRLTLLDGSTNPLWPKLGTVKTSKVNIYGDALIKGNVYGGGEQGMVRGDSHVTIGGILEDNNTVTSTNDDHPTIYSDVFGGGYGSDDRTETEITAEGFGGATNTYTFTPMQLAGIVCGDSYVNIKRGWVQKNVYGGGEMATVGLVDYAAAAEAGNKHDDVDNGFALSWPYKLDFRTYDDAGLSDAIGGTCYINITGGSLGKPNLTIDNGDVYGGGKGIAGDRYDYAFCANVKATDVTIDYPANAELKPSNYNETNDNGSYKYDCITGAVYGGGENGHVIENTKVTLKNGLIGHSLYGGGSGKGQYRQRLLKIGAQPISTNPDVYKETDYHNVSIYSITAGKVYGNTKVKMEGGYVVRNIYGGGNMGSVGKGNYSGGADDYSTDGYGETLIGDLWTSTYQPDNTKDGYNPNKDNAWYFLNSGNTEVDVIGGEIGYVDTTDPNKSMYPLKDKKPYDASLPYGNVFGGCRGESAPNISETPRYHYSPEFFSGYVNETKVTIGGYKCKTAYSTYNVGDCITASEFDALASNVQANWEKTNPKILASVFGGGQDGHVRRDTHVIINSGEIGLPFTDEPDENGVKYRTLFGKTANTPINEELDNHQWLQRGNVYGAGSGIGHYRFDFNNDGDTEDTHIQYGKDPKTGEDKYVDEEDFSTSAGSVTRFTKVEVKGGTIHRNVYGGGSMASVGAPQIRQNYLPYKKNDADATTKGKQSLCTVMIGGAGNVTIGTPDEYREHYGGEVYGASRGSAELGESFGSVIWTLVKILNGATIQGNAVKQDTDVQIGPAE